MHIVPLDKARHERKRFDCGVEALNNYLKLIASQQSKKDNSRTFVMEDGMNSQEQEIVGFYTLTMLTINLTLLPKNLQKKHKNAYSSGLIARLAVDKRYAKKGFGSLLLIDALKKLLMASDTVGYPMVIVDAKVGASAFYEHFGVTSFLDEENKLYISIADVRASFNA